MSNISRTAFHSILCLFLFLYFCNCKPAPSETQTSDIDPLLIEEAAFQLLKENPSEAIVQFQIAGQKYKSAKNLEREGITYLNIANVYDEYLNFPDSALIFAEKSYSVGLQSRDTLHQANLLKYIGLLKGRTGNYEAGIEVIYQAIDLFEKMDYAQGVAVSYFDLAQTHFEFDAYQKSRQALEKANAFWQTVDNKSRIFTNNLLAIRLNHKIGNFDAIEKLITENEEIIEVIDLNPYILEQYNKVLSEIERRD